MVTGDLADAEARLRLPNGSYGLSEDFIINSENTSII